SIRPVNQPQVSVTKFVPYSDLEADYEVNVIGDITMPDYKKFRLPKPNVKVETKDVDEVMSNLRQRSATKQVVERAAKDGDEVTIDFAGVDAKTKEAIAGADGKDYPLVIGSNTFIPGFEPELVGLQAGDDKTFTVTFPKDYGAAELQNRQVSFTVHVSQVQELTEPKLDDAFAASVGPFKTIAELKADIKKQLQADREQQSRQDYESAVLEALANKTKVAIPDEIIDEEVQRAEAEERRNLTYRGTTWQEHLEQEGVSEEEHRAKQRPSAELRIRAGLVLSEVAEREGIRVTPDEVDVRMQLLKGQYQDPAMQAELDKPEARRDIASRMLSEKTIGKLTEYASAK
ncbi:MAG TPA: trigger factor, partial [Candidatus Saccharimonadales bacterium]|nr:trigger factor [Candidatus Saccharimonadales bacterium]